MKIIEICAEIMYLGYPHGINVHTSPFHAHEGTLNTICSEKKSTPRVEVYYPLAAGFRTGVFLNPQC